jgi:hypothetical protein
MVCIRCGKRPHELSEYVTEAAAETQILREEDALLPDDPGISPEQWAWDNEGTVNKENGHFACTPCYFAMGMPTASGAGWKAP